MVLFPANTPHSKTWQICDLRTNSWREWDGEMVVYDDLSGDTMKLDAVVSEVFRLLLEGPATLGQTADHLATTFEVPSGVDLQGLAAAALSRLQEARLVAPLTCSDAQEHRS